MPQASDLEKIFWKSIWKIKVPGKIKHFIWKACSNSLPTEDNLLKRKLLQEAVCYLCPNDIEDVLHALWGCDRLKKVWVVDFSWVDKSRVLLGSFSDLLKMIQGRPHTVALFAATTWSIWYHRNKTHLNEASLPLEKISSFGRDYIQDFKSLVRIPPCSRRRVSKKWCPPASDCWKINFDDAMFGESDEAGIRVVIRNSKVKLWLPYPRRLRSHLLWIFWNCLLPSELCSPSKQVLQNLFLKGMLSSWSSP